MKKRKKTSFQNHTVEKMGMEPVLLMVLGMLMVGMAVLIGTTNIRWYLSAEGFIPNINPLFLLVPGILILFFGFRLTSKYPSKEDISSLQGFVLLLVCLTVGVIIRLYHMNLPFGGWWGDQIHSLDNAWDSYVHHNIPLIYSWGWRPSFPTLFQILIFNFFPFLSGPTSLRLSGTLIEACSLVIFYFLGKEVGSRRTGIIMVAMAVISRAMLDRVFQFVDLSVFPFIIALTLLVFFRLIHKPTVARFVQWGIVTALGSYTYDGYRAWAPFIIFCIACWIFFQRKNHEIASYYVLIFTGPVLWILWFFRANHVVFWNPFLVSHASDGFYFALAILFFAAFGRVFYRFGSLQKEQMAAGFGLGLIVAAVLSFPLVLDPGFSQRSNQVINLNFVLNPMLFLKFVSNSAAELINVFFVNGKDIWTSGPNYQTLFSLDAIVLIVVGLIYSAVKPTKEKLWILLFLVPGIIPYLVVMEPHTGRLMGTLPPLYLLAALGGDRIWGIFSYQANRWGRILAVLMIGIFSFWGGWANLRSVWAYANIPRAAVYSYRQALSAVPYGRVYMEHFLQDYTNLNTLEAFIRNQDIYSLSPSNPILLLKGEAVPNVSVLCPHDNQPCLQMLKREYPHAQWEEKLNRPPNLPNFYFWEIQIPAKQMNDNPKKLFYIKTVSLSDVWLRKFYGSDYGLARGVVFFEDAVENPNAPFLKERATWMEDDPLSVKLEKEVEIEKTGIYTFSIDSMNPYRFMLENNKKYLIFSRYTYATGNKTESKTLYLLKGTYKIEFYCVAQSGGIPQIVVQSPDHTQSLW